jgi:hypothetical protein
MLLGRVEYSGRHPHLLGISQAARAADPCIAHGEELVTFAGAGVAGDVADLATARCALREGAYSGALVDAVAGVGNFK